MYAHEMRSIDALPQGAAETASMGRSPPTVMMGWDGRNGARCSATQIGLRKYFSFEGISSVE